MNGTATAHGPDDRRPRPQGDGAPGRAPSRDGRGGPAVRGRGLSAGHFRKISTNGFGDGSNSYAWSCAWYDGHVYIGTNRNMLYHVNVIAKKRDPGYKPPGQWPVPLPASEEEMDLRAQIWRYNPKTLAWQCVYRSPMTRGKEGRIVPLAPSFRNMAVFQGRRDARPAIYTISGAGTYGLGPHLHRSPDGERFELVSEPGLGLNDPSMSLFRGVVAFKGRLFISPCGSRGGHANTSNCTILCSDDPASGRWEMSNIPAFGDPTNHGIFDVYACGDRLYAGTINIRYGCQLWRSEAEGPPPHRWVKVLERGAGRGQTNQAISAFAAYRGALYFCTSIQGGGYDRTNNVGPAAGEVLRVYPDDTWDLVVGDPRMTDQGLKLPRSGLGAGFDNRCAGYLWRIHPHDGSLYVGTFDQSSLLPYCEFDKLPGWVGRLLDESMLENIMRTRGGCELWRTDDGDRWTPVIRNGFGNYFNWGIRSLLSTPAGLFVGTANPFGPLVAVRGPAGWRYEPNPMGGVEVWHGSHDHGSVPEDEYVGDNPGDTAPWARDHTSDLLDEVFRIPDLEPSNASTPGAPLLADLADLIGVDDHDRLSHDLGALKVGKATAWRGDPVRDLVGEDREGLGLFDDTEGEVEAYFGAGSLRNMGFWRDPTLSPHQACEQLVKELLAFARPSESPASILAIGGGVEALALRLLLAWPSAALTALRFRDPVAAAPRAAEPGIRVVESGPERLVVPDESFDLVVWIEGPSARGLREAHRALRPGGRLLATDWIAAPADRAEVLPVAPAHELAGEYRLDLGRAGFAEATVVDVTRRTWWRFHRHSREYFATKRLFQQLDRDREARVFAALPGGGQAVAAYVLVSAIKSES